MNHVEQRAHGADVQASDHGRFFGVGFGDYHAGNFSSAGFDSNGERATDAAHPAVKREFSDEEAIRHFFFGEAPVRTDDAEGHGQVESGTFFLNVGGSEVDGDVRRRDIIAAVFQRGADAAGGI